MAPKNRGKKRVRIQSGHEARYIEHRRTRKKPQAKKKPRLEKSKLGSYIKPHRPTVTELVYQFLEQASRSGVHKRRKTNATSQFRKLQRRNRSKRIKPVKQTPSIVRSVDGDDDDYFAAPYPSVPTKKANDSIEKCIYDVLSFGAIMGLLEPVDKKGVVFRVASDLDLYTRKLERNKKRKSSCDCQNDDAIE